MKIWGITPRVYYDPDPDGEWIGSMAGTWGAKTFEEAVNELWNFWLHRITKNTIYAKRG
jgi:hypothetical protein